MRYTREDGCRAWLTYGLLRPDVLRELLDTYGSAEAIYEHILREKSGAFLKKHRVSQGSIDALVKQSDEKRMHEMMVLMRDLEVGILSMDDARYPDALRHIEDPPPLLFYRGDPDCLMGKCLGVVGSRRASPQGVEVTRRICRELSDAGVTIVSGFAVGIDTAAHEGCLDGASPTAAILGTGIDVDYPAENMGLRERILNGNGVLLTEYPFGMRASKFVFQHRNRIISGLSKAVVMMECRIQSGSMLTVQHALDQGKDVYAYPGTPGTEWAEGAHQLLREGAMYFAYARDILEDQGWLNDAPLPTPVQKQALPPMDENQRKVYQQLGYGERSFDQLAAATALQTGELSVALTMLQMMGLIKSLPGKCYSRM